MSSTQASRVKTVAAEQELQPVVRWRNWPLTEARRSSWWIVVAIVAIVAVAANTNGSSPTALIGAIGLFVTLWQFFVPVEYEVATSGLRRTALGRTRLVPWPAIRAYQFRETGAVLFQRHDPARIDVLRSLFVPFPSDAEEAREALRRAMFNAIELP